MPNDEKVNQETGEVHTGEVMPAIREPEAGIITLEHLAQVIDGDFIESYADLLGMARKASIAMTEPEDWVLFRRPSQDGEEGRVTAYLQDSGAQRIEDLWQIEVKPPGNAQEFPKERIGLPEAPDEFAWTITGDGICHRTGKKVYAIEGVRRSDEDFVKYKKGIQREIEVRKAAFANLHGGIVRRLTGLGSVSIRLLDDVWKATGTGKTSAHCARGKGYGTQAERAGEARNVEYGDPPKCPTCQSTMVLRQGKRGPFWGCPKYPKCEQKPIDAKPIAAKAPEQEQDDFDRVEKPGEKSPPPPANGGENLGASKNKLLEMIKGKPYEKEIKTLVTKAKTSSDILDIQTLISDREKGGQ